MKIKVTEDDDRERPMNIVATVWKCGFDNVGVVLIETKVGGRKAYIGLALGVGQKADAQRIASLGVKLSLAEAKGFFPEIKDEDYDR